MTFGSQVKKYELVFGMMIASQEMMGAIKNPYQSIREREETKTKNQEFSVGAGQRERGRIKKTMLP